MSSELTYDDSGLQRLWEGLSTKARREGLRGGIRAIARRGLAMLRANIKASGINTERQIEMSAWSQVYTKRIGFLLSVGPQAARKSKPRAAAGLQKKRKTKKRAPAINTPGLHTNRRGVIVPALLYASRGVASRRTSKGANRGAMPVYDFMGRTRAQVTPMAQADMAKAISEYVIQTAKKYGCDK